MRANWGKIYGVAYLTQQGIKVRGQIRQKQNKKGDNIFFI